MGTAPPARLAVAVVVFTALVTAAAGARAEDRATGTPQALGAPPVHGSISCGAANRGALSYGAALPAAGPSWVVPATWVKRGFSYGTDELVGAIQRAAQAVNAQYPGSVLGVADLSKSTGGAVPHHRSHQSGRDADLLYYAVDDKGRYFAPDDLMPIYRYSGKATYSKAPRWQPRIPVRYFDLARNWALVKALLTDRDATVTHIFVSYNIRAWLLKYAGEAGESAEMIKRARAVLRVPGRRVSKHDDHMHIRVACGDDDMVSGRCMNDSYPARRRGGKKWRSRITCPR